MKKKMHKAILMLAAASMLFACSKGNANSDQSEVREDETAAVSATRPVTISAGLPSQTKVAHSLSGTKIHPTWESGDQVKIVFTLGEEEISEIFTLKDGAGTQSASFYKADSRLGDDVPFTLHYPATDAGWAVQDGTLEHLPESLSADFDNLSQTATLAPALTYFHVVFNNFEGSYTSAYLSKQEGAFSIYSAPGTKGAITVTPAAGFSSASVDFYVAVMIEGNTSAQATDIFGDAVAPRLQLAFANGTQGVSQDAQAFDLVAGSSIYNWSPAKDYVPGKVYKLENKTLSQIIAAKALPR